MRSWVLKDEILFAFFKEESRVEQFGTLKSDSEISNISSIGCYMKMFTGSSIV